MRLKFSPRTSGQFGVGISRIKKNVLRNCLTCVVYDFFNEKSKLFVHKCFESIIAVAFNITLLKLVPIKT